MAKKLIACMLSISMAATALVTPLGEHVSKLFKLPTFSTNAIQIEDTFNLDDSSETIIKFKTDISKSNPIVNLSGTNFSYTGKAITPFVSFRRSSTAVRDLKVGTEITVSYKNNVNPGTATVIITGINEYKGTVTKTFTISDQTTSADEEVIKTGSEETIWTGSEDLGKWNKDVDLGIAGIPLAEEGGILTIIYQDKGTAQISVINKVGDSWIWTELIDSATGNVYFETTGGKLQIKLTAEQAKQFATSKAIFLKGQNVIVTKMTYTAPGSDDSDDSSKTETTGTIINIENPVTDAWNNCFPKYDSGYGKEIDDYIDAKTFTKDTAMDVTVNFEWVDGVEYVQFKPAFANGWAAYQAGGYLTNVNILGTDCTAVTDGAGIGYLTNDGETVGYAMQTSGFFISNDPSCNQVKFTITADGVNKAIENATADDSAFDGLVFQISGVKITSIELSQSGVRLASQHNTPIPDESSVDWSSTDYDDSSHSDIPEWDESDFDNTIGTTIIIKNPVTDAWNNCFPKYDSGYGKKIDDYIDAKTFTKDTPMNVTVNFEWTKYATEQGYIQFRPAFANDWDSIFRYGYMTNVNVIGKNCEYIQDGVGLKTNSGKLIKYAIQSDGFFFSNDPTCNQVRFTITADGVNQMIKNSYYDDGIVLQINGLKVTSIELSQYGVKTASGLSGDLISGNYKYRIINEKAVEIIKYNGSEVNLTIPSIIDGKKVTKIGSNAFENCNRLTSLTIPNSVTNIGEGAFRNCHSLTKIIIPKSVTGIGDYAFYNCDSLLNVTIPDGITEIGNGVFEWCVSLKSVIIPNTVTSIGNSSFAYCNSLTSIKLPNSIKNIDDGAFESCSNLKNITIPIKTEIIGIKVFSGCYNLESVLIPDSVTTIMTNAFASCINLKNVYYTGSKAEWNDIVIASNNDYLKKATVHYNYDPNHKHSYKSTVVKPTYAAQGYTLHKCSTCGASYKDNYKAKLTLGNITKVNFNSSANAVKMSWSKVSGATGYRVYKYNTSTKKWQAVANVKGTSYTFSKLKAGTTYKFTVRAYRTEGGKTYLSPKYSTFTTSTNPATVNFKVTAGSKKATVKWSKVTGATGYKVYYKTSKNGSWKCLKTTNNKTTSYTKTGLTKGKTYYFTVKAYRTVSGKTYNGSYATKSVKVK